MTTTLRSTLTVAALVLAGAFAHAGDPAPAKKVIVPTEEEHWKFLLASPGWLAGVEGTVGINGIDSDIDVGFHDLINKINMVAAFRAEASKGRFGIMGELIYMSMSDSLGVGGPLRKVDVRVDEYLADFSLRWRLVEGERGFVDALVGVRYTNLYQQLHLQGDSAGINEASENFVDNVSDVIRDRLNEVLNSNEFRNALTGAVATDITAQFADPLGPNPRRRALAIGALGGRQPLRVAALVEDIIRKEEARLRSDINALKLKGTARAAEVQRRVAAAKDRLEQRVSDVLEKNLNRTFSRCDDWFDPYVGVRARYNFTPAIYVIGRADIGGFGIGSDLMWQAEGALGVQVTRNVYAEIGYRALSFDYDKDGLTFDTITHGAQITVGREF
jgi:hypothetical protein